MSGEVGISDYAKSIGVIPQNKEWSYLRDVWWPNVRKLTTEKTDNAQSTGTGGGKDKIFTDVDNMVWEIIGKDSPLVKGLDVSKSGESSNCEVPQTSVEMKDVSPKKPTKERSGFSENVGSQLLIQTGPTEEMKDTPHIETSVPQKFVAPLNLNSKPTKSFCPPSTDDEKKRLQVELLKLQIYKTKLECRKLEMEMNIPESSFTRNMADETSSLVNGNEISIVIDENLFN